MQLYQQINIVDSHLDKSIYTAQIQYNSNLSIDIWNAMKRI